MTMKNDYHTEVTYVVHRKHATPEEIANGKPQIMILAGLFNCGIEEVGSAVRAMEPALPSRHLSLKVLEYHSMKGSHPEAKDASKALAWHWKCKAEFAAVKAAHYQQAVEDA